MRTLMFVLVLAVPGFAFAQNPAGSIIRGYEAGAAARRADENAKADAEMRALANEYYRQQIKLMEQQNKKLAQDIDSINAGVAVQNQQIATAKQKQIVAEVDRDFDAFMLRHTDWKKVETPIACLAGKFNMGKLEMSEFLEMLYLMAKSEVWSAQCPNQSSLPLPQ